MFTQEELNTLIQTAIDEIAYPEDATRLFDPIRYILGLGGKRLRPALVLMAANLYTDEIKPALTPAIGLELYHNFTLLHDDVMDNAPSRRGKPTVHVRWNNNTAILSGDVMQALAYQMIAEAPAPNTRKVLDLFTQTNIQICQGQQYDMEFESRMDVSTDEYIEMIRLKTAVLLGCALKMGAIIGGATEKDTDLLYRFGENIGLAFQLQDDWLDCWGNPETFGKCIGGDITNGKKTFLLINALKNAESKDRKTMTEELAPESSRLNKNEKIACFCNIYKKCGAEQACREAILHYHRQALDLLENLSIPQQNLEPLKALADKLINRSI